MLDLRHLGRDLILTKLNQIHELARDLAGVDLITETVPIRPGMHYQMGGVKTDIDGRSTLPGLYAAGECACVSVHGANRLGGNSLLETVVFGRRAGRTAAQEAEQERFINLTPVVARDEAGRIDALLSRSDRGIRAAALRKELGVTMQEHAGIFRDAAGLSAGIDLLHDLKDRYEAVSIQDHGSVFNTDLVSALELGNMLDLAEVMVTSSLERRESRGAHARRDYPERGRRELAQAHYRISHAGQA